MPQFGVKPEIVKPKESYFKQTGPPSAQSRSNIVGMGAEASIHTRKACNCRNSKCLKLYCECFASGVYCIPGHCNCNPCQNNIMSEDVR